MKPGSFRRYCNAMLALAVVLGLASAFGGRWLSAEGRGGLAGVATAFGGMWLVFRLMPRWWTEQVADEYASTASVAYRRRVMPAMAAYCVLIFTTLPLLRSGSITALPLRALVAVAPAVPIFFVFHAFLRYVRTIDELKRRIELEAVGIGAMIVCLVYLPLSFLQLAKVVDIPSGEAMLYVFPLMCMGYGIGKFITMRRYR